MKQAQSGRSLLHRWEVLPLLALCVVVFLAWGVTRDRLSLRNWSVPISYSGDTQQTLSWIKAAAEGDYLPFHDETIHRLGAPYHANWNDYPMYEKIPTALIG